VTTSVVPNCATTPDTSGSGSLQLTTNGGSLVGSTYYKVSMPTSQGLDMNFDTYQYDGSGADGISFSLAAVNPADPAAPSTTGQIGGALGYSTNGSTGAGLPYGYLGLGLDVYGNYENTTYSGSGCTTPTGMAASTLYPESVTARGPGDGTAGYCILNSTAQTYQKTSGGGSDTDTITNLSTTQGSGGEYLDNQSATATRATVEVPVEVVLNPSATAAPAQTSGLSVPANSYLIAYKALNSTGWQSISGALPTTTNNTELAAFPSSWINPTTHLPYQLAMGWTSSTGGSTEYHQLNNFSASSFVGQVPVASITSTDNQSGEFLAGGNTTFTVTPGLASTGGSEGDEVTAIDTFPAGITPGTATGTGWTCATSGQTVTCTYTPSTPLAAGSSFPPISIPGAISSSATGSLTSNVQESSNDGLYGAASDTGTVYKMTASSTSSTYPNVPTLSVANLPSVATGTVAFTTGSTTWCTATLPTTSCSPTSVTAGTQAITATYSGNSNFSSVTATTSMAVVKDTTTTAVSEAPTTVTYGNEAATLFHVTVTTGNGESVPNGETVSVSAGCTVTLSSGTGSCTIPDTELPAGGPDAVSATYGGDTNLGGSSGNAGTGVTVGKDTSATTLTATPGTEAYGAEATTQFHVAVTTGNGENLPATGETVTVHVGTVSCVATLTQGSSGGAGNCTIANTALPVGPYTASATYGGDADISASPSAGTASFAVTGAATTTTLATIAPSSTYGAETAETFTANVTSTQGTPTGTVTVTGSVGTLCTITLSAGTGTCTLTATQLTPQQVTGVVATYNASGNFAGSASTPAQTFTVVPDSTTTAVSATPSSSAYGSEGGTSFAVAVTTGQGETMSNSGESVTVQVGTASCVATLTPVVHGGSGTCTIAASALPAGPYTASATYGGDTELLASPVPGTAPFTVTKEATTTTVSQTDPSLPYGAEYLDTFSVDVSAVNGATVPNGETVLVTAGLASCTATLTANVGSCQIGPTDLSSGGPDAVSASYPGDNNLQGSSGNAVSGVTVSNDTTTTTLTATPASDVYGNESVTPFTVAVITGNGEVLPANGEQVTVNVGTTSCVATLSPIGQGGLGTCTIADTALPPGPYTASAAYGGDGDLDASPTATTPFAVTAASSATSLSPLVDTTYGAETGETFTVNMASAGGVPTGTVAVTSTQGPLCTITLSAGTGSCTLTATQLPAGAITNVVAAYSGDPDFATSNSQPQSFAVDPDTTTTAVTASPASASYGNESATTFTSSVLTGNGEAIPASGETLTIGVGAASCTATLVPSASGGSGTCTIANTALPVGSYTASATYGGDADLLASAAPGATGFSVTNDSSTTALSALPTPATYGNESATTFTVSVATGNGEAIPASGETVAVDVGTASCTATLAPTAPGGSGTCAIGNTDLPVGSYTASATYGGDGDLNGSPLAATAPLSVVKDSTTTLLSATPSTNAYGDEAATSFAVAVSTGNGEPIPAPGETVTVTVGPASCVATMSPFPNGGLGTCQITNTDLAAGTYTASATYGGDSDLDASATPGTAGLTVGQDGTTTSISATPAGDTYGNEAATSFAVTVATANGEPVPSSGETVAVNVGTAMCTVTLVPAGSGGTGSCSIANTALPVGSYTATATYGGDGSLGSSPTAATTPFTVGPDSSTTALTATPTSEPYGSESATSFAVNVATGNGEALPAVGESTTVTVGSASCVTDLTPASGGATGSCSIGNSDLGGGTYTASATYGGDADLSPSPTAGTAAFDVTTDTTTTAITSSPHSATYGDESAIPFSVSVLTSNGEPIPGIAEVVPVHVGAASCLATLVPGATGGIGSCTIPETALPVGSYTASAAYGGDPSLLGSVPTTTPFTVTPDTTITELSVMPTNQTFGNEAATTFAVAVLTGNGEMMPDSGETVTVNVGPTTCVATLDAIGQGGLGDCQVANTGLPAGTYTASAIYGGDTNLLASAHPGTAGFTVNPDGTTTSITATPASVPYGSESSTSFTVSVSTANGEPIPGNSETVPVTVGTATCTVTLVPAGSGGSGSCTIANDALPAGHYTASAIYAGDPSASASPTTAMTPFTVTKPVPDLTSSESPNPATAGQIVTYSVTGLPSDATGTVAFTTGTVTLCTLILPATSCSSASAPIGTDPVVAAYSGDPNYAPASSDSSLVVNAAPVAHNVSGSGAFGSPVNIQLPTPSGTGPFTYTISTQPSAADGTCQISSGGLLTFTPATGYVGTATCDYTVMDAHGLTSAPATATVEIAAAGTSVPAAHTGEPWSGWPYWVGLAMVLGLAYMLVGLGRRRSQQQ
jgi:hypothetical protein